MAKRGTNEEEQKKTVSDLNPIKKIAKYAWTDEDAKVKIYIDLE